VHMSAVSWALAEAVRPTVSRLGLSTQDAHRTSSGRVNGAPKTSSVDEIALSTFGAALRPKSTQGRCRKALSEAIMERQSLLHAGGAEVYQCSKQLAGLAVTHGLHLHEHIELFIFRQLVGVDNPSLQEGVGVGLRGGLHQVQDLPNHALRQGRQHIVVLDLLVCDMSQVEPALDVRKPGPRLSVPKCRQF
jgi:hypothetical protein